jgi:hypothetical protein
VRALTPFTFRSLFGCAGRKVNVSHVLRWVTELAGGSLPVEGGVPECVSSVYFQGHRAKPLKGLKRRAPKGRPTLYPDPPHVVTVPVLVFDGRRCLLAMLLGPAGLKSSRSSSLEAYQLTYLTFRVFKFPVLVVISRAFFFFPP